MSRSYLYQAFGFVFRSEIELPGVADAEKNAQPSAVIRWGETPATLPDAADRAEYYGMAHEATFGSILITVDEVGRFFVRAGREIIIQPEEGASELDIRVYLMGSAFGSLLHQRGMTPLHASAMRVGQACVAFTGASGAGKSTLAAFCRERGYDVICDDLCPMTLSAECGPVVWPGFPRMKVWIDALEALGISAEEATRVQNKYDKFELPVRDQLDRPLPLKRLYVLNGVQQLPGDDAPGIERLSGTERLESLLYCTYRYKYLKGLGLRKRHFEVCTAALRDLCICRLTYIWDLAQIDQTLDLLEEDFARIGLL